MQEHISEAIEVKIETLRKKEEDLKLKTGELLKTREQSAEILLGRMTDAEQTVSQDSFDAISDNRKKVGQ